MKSIILYSSLTGNTKSVAEAMASVMPEGTPCVPVKDAPENLADYDTVLVGFWVDRGTANKEAAKLIETLKNPNVVFFATLGMYADSDHARESIEKASELLPNKETLVDGFVCQGKIDPKVIEMMYKMFPPGSAHGQSPERDALHKAAETHPDEQDFANAKEFTKSVLAKLQA